MNSFRPIDLKELGLMAEFKGKWVGKKTARNAPVSSYANKLISRKFFHKS